MDHHLHGATTTERLRESGLGTRGIAAKVKRGELVRVRRNTYLHAAAPRTTQQIAAIGLLAVKERGVVTGATGVRWAGGEVRGRRTVDIVVPEGLATPVVPGVAYRHSSYLDHLRVVQIHGLPVARIEWSIGDLARDLDDRELAWVIARAVGAGLTTVARLLAHLQQRPNFPGSARLRRVIAQLTDDMPFSGTEKKAARMLREAGMPFVLQFEIVECGALLRTGDLVLPNLRFDLELDGPHHRMPEQAMTDRRIDSALRAVDWSVERVPVHDVDDHPKRFVAQVDRQVQRLRARAAHPGPSDLG